MRQIICGIVTLSILISATAHAASVWDNTAGDNDLTNLANWSSDPLSATSYLNIALSGVDRAILSDGMNLTVNDVRVGINTEPGMAGELEIAGGTLRSARGGGDTRIGYSGRTGTVNQSGGAWEVAQDLAVGMGGTGIYNLSGGELDHRVGTFRIGQTGTDFLVPVDWQPEGPPENGSGSNIWFAIPLSSTESNRFFKLDVQRM